MCFTLRVADLVRAIDLILDTDPNSAPSDAIETVTSGLDHTTVGLRSDRAAHQELPLLRPGRVGTLQAWSGPENGVPVYNAGPPSVL